MLQKLVFIAFLFLGLFSLNSFAEIPSGCRECLSECPHQTRDINSCDRGCPGVCSVQQFEEWKLLQQTETANVSCYECMSACPHQTRDIKDCDRGCPGKCDLAGMKDAFIKANSAAQSCGGTMKKTTSRRSATTPN